MTEIEDEDPSGRSTRERKELARARWESLPQVLKEIFQNAPNLSMYQVLRKLGVDAQATRAVEWAYVTRDGTAVVTMWHDQISMETDGTLCCLIETAKWRRTGALEQQRADRMRKILADNGGKNVKVMLLKREWKGDTKRAKVVTADMRGWTLKQLSEGEFVLKRMARR